MSPRGRLAFLLALLAFVAAAKALQPGPFFSLSADPDPFPATFVASAPAAPNVHQEQPNVRVIQLLSSMNAMWERAFAAAGDEYQAPRLETAGESEHQCGRNQRGWAGVYCRTGTQIVVDMDDHLVGRAAVGEDAADDRLGYVLAHEVGHHVQHLRGLYDRQTQETTVRAELHAECLAGVWGRAAGRRPPPAWTFSSDADHGSADEQREWFARGYAAARPADCDAIWEE